MSVELDEKEDPDLMSKEDLRTGRTVAYRCLLQKAEADAQIDQLGQKFLVSERHCIVQ